MKDNNYIYWKNLLEKNSCFKCQKKIACSEKDFEEDKEFHPNCYIKREGICHYECWIEEANQKLKKLIQKNEKNNFVDWKEMVNKYPCFSCDYDFTELEIQEDNWQIDYYDCYGVKEINWIKHLDCRGWCKCQLCRKICEKLKNNHEKCSSCDKQFSNLVIRNYLEKPFHPECFEKNKTYLFHSHPRILSLKVDEQRITATLENERQASISIRWLIEEKYHWLKKKFKPEQIKEMKYKIDKDGFRVDFWTDDEDNEEFDLTVFMFTEGNYLGKCGCCSSTNYEYLTSEKKKAINKRLIKSV